jgi:hypothetical protein
MRSTALALVATLAVGTTVLGAGTAAADPSKGKPKPPKPPLALYAPHTQAAALVAPNGDLVKTKKIKASKKVAPGSYCVTLDKKINPTVSVPTATLDGVNSTRGGSIHVITYPTKKCGFDKHTLTVLLFDSKGKPANGSFYVTVQ